MDVRVMTGCHPHTQGCWMSGANLGMSVPDQWLGFSHPNLGAAQPPHSQHPPTLSLPLFSPFQTVLFLFLSLHFILSLNKILT